MKLILLGMMVQWLGGLLALTVSKKAWKAHWMGAGSAVLGSVLSLVGLTRALMGIADSTFERAWSVPFGSFSVGVDPLSGLFLVAIAIAGSACAVYGMAYLGESRSPRKLGSSWFFFNTLLASMMLVVTSRNAVLFLAAWEAMSLSSFFLVTFEHEREQVRSAGWLYLIASHLGTAVLLGMFLLLGDGGSLSFDAFSASANEHKLTSVIFILALLGFGVKAGFVPVHVWLPEAHPAAPSHVSALMSGVMIKTGIYGIIRVLQWLGPAQAWWGWVLVVVGLTSGLLGVLLALAQHDVKRLLAYSSVENAGIIALGLGVGTLGMAGGNEVLGVLGYSGALLHVLNHSLFKSLLFLGAGSIIHVTHTRKLDEMGGLMRRMPQTGIAFLIGSMAIAGLPPLNGFISEWLVYSGLLYAAMDSNAATAALAFAGCAGLALIGGLAAALFIKAGGVILLGSGRKPLPVIAHDPPRTMLVGMWVLVAGCIGVAAFSPVVLDGLAPVVAFAVSMPVDSAVEALQASADMLRTISMISAGFVALVAVLWIVRYGLFRLQPPRRSPTWDCGYVAPSARMQYTESSFSQPLVDIFGIAVRSSKHGDLPKGIFPPPSSFATREHDVWMEVVFGEAFRRVSALFDRLHWIQRGNAQLYVLYVVLTCIALLLWKLY